MISNFVKGLFIILWGASTLAKTFSLTGIALATVSGQTWDDVIAVTMSLAAASFMLGMITTIVQTYLYGMLTSKPKPKVLPYLKVCTFSWTLVVSVELAFMILIVAAYLMQNYEVMTIVKVEMAASFVSFVSNMVLLVANRENLRITPSA